MFEKIDLNDFWDRVYKPKTKKGEVILTKEQFTKKISAGAFSRCSRDLITYHIFSDFNIAEPIISQLISFLY